MIRRFGQAPERARRYILRPGAYAILPLDGQILVTAQMTDVIEYQLPGGGIDAGESPLQALYREVREEIGWSIAQPRRLGAFRRFVFMPEYDLWAEKLCHVYVARPARQIQAPTEPDHETVMLPTSLALTALGNAGDISFLQRYLAGLP